MKKHKLSKNSIKSVNHAGKKKSNWGAIIVIIIIGTFLMSTFAYSIFNSSTNKDNIYEYNGFKFLLKNNYWELNVGNKIYQMLYLPVDLEDVKIDFQKLDVNNKIYLMFDPEQFNENTNEILYLRQYFLQRGNTVSLACSEEKSCGDLPILNCNSGENILFLRDENDTKVYKENNCLVLGAYPGQEFKTIMKFIYSDLGVI